MLSAGKAKQGKHGKAGEEANRLSHDAVKLLKSQDAGYLRTVAGRGRKELARLEQAVGLERAMKIGGDDVEGAGGKSKKIIFVDGEDVEGQGKRKGQKRKIDEMMSEHDDINASYAVNNGTDTAETGVDALVDVSKERTTTAKSKSKKALQAEQQAKLDLRAVRKRRKRLGELRAAKLEALKKRQREVLAVADQLELQRAKMNRTVGGMNKDGVKWKIRERKK